MLIGFGGGVLLTALAVWFVLRRHLKRAKAAERRARAAERMAEIGSMTGGLAHEIKNPLSTIGLNAQLLVEGVQELSIADDERSRLLNRAKSLRRETERLAGILADFLQFAGQIHLDRRPSDVNAVVAELCDFFLPEAERHGVRLRTELSATPLVCSIDAKMVKQALLNLMLNATQAMAGRPGAAGPKELIIRTGRSREPGNAIAANIHVIDTGPGIDAQTLEKIFSPYFTTKSGGTGLGLPTSRRLIQEHGGRIDVHSEPGRGSDFTVVLPMGAER